MQIQIKILPSQKKILNNHKNCFYEPFRQSAELTFKLGKRLYLRSIFASRRCKIPLASVLNISILPGTHIESG
jgi:hypothetical protein